MWKEICNNSNPSNYVKIVKFYEICVGGYLILFVSSAGWVANWANNKGHNKCLLKEIDVNINWNSLKKGVIKLIFKSDILSISEWINYFGNLLNLALRGIFVEKLEGVKSILMLLIFSIDLLVRFTYR